MMQLAHLASADPERLVQPPDCSAGVVEDTNGAALLRNREPGWPRANAIDALKKCDMATRGGYNNNTCSMFSPDRVAAPGCVVPRHTPFSESRSTTRIRGTNRMLAEGTVAPDFTVDTDEGKSVSLRDYRGRWVVLYFYPKADTPG
jgi:hypothetical protein